MGKVKKVEVMKVNKRPEMLFENDPEMQKNYFVKNAGRVFDQIHDTLCALPAFLEVVERLVPVEERASKRSSQNDGQEKRGHYC